MSTQIDPLAVSADLLYSVKTDGESASLRSQLARLDPGHLEWALSSRRHRLAFWLNVFNASVQLIIEDRGGRFRGSRYDRWSVFARDRVEVAGTQLRLTDIRDGMLRHSRARWGRGYVPRVFPSRFERRFRLPECDPRIHFALSSADDHSPPVTIFSPAEVDEELDVATEWHLAETVTHDPNRRAITVPRLFKRYRGDFGGASGIRGFLARYDVPVERAASIEYASFDRPVDVTRF
ncbi:DUF547 domain-containing protein [Halovivax cerinus]|uniref:DUF547 domain-containing protein n=1 Tax=Halovivax cerinus TaxID=1487865 RepID=A0ABD5NJT0_9EURY|nr:DUF547 domain-containing protein [Halovivax cerinus]